MVWPNSTTRTCCTTSPMDTPQQFYNLLDNFSATNEHVVQQILPHPNILTCQDVGLWSCHQRTSCTTCSCSGVQLPTSCTTIISIPPNGNADFHHVTTKWARAKILHLHWLQQFQHTCIGLTKKYILYL